MQTAHTICGFSSLKQMKPVQRVDVNVETVLCFIAPDNYRLLTQQILNIMSFTKTVIVSGMMYRCSRFCVHTL